MGLSQCLGPMKTNENKLRYFPRLFSLLNNLIMFLQLIN